MCVYFFIDILQVKHKNLRIAIVDSLKTIKRKKLITINKVSNPFFLTCLVIFEIILFKLINMLLYHSLGHFVIYNCTIKIFLKRKKKLYS